MTHPQDPLRCPCGLEVRPRTQDSDHPPPFIILTSCRFSGLPLSPQNPPSPLLSSPLPRRLSTRIFFTARRCVRRDRCCRRVSVRLSVCPSHDGAASKRLDGSSWFWHGRFLPPVVHCVPRKFDYPQALQCSAAGNFVPNAAIRNRPVVVFASIFVYSDVLIRNVNNV